MADECTDIATIIGVVNLLPLRRKWITFWAFHENPSFEETHCWIYSTLIEWLNKKSIQRRKMVGLGFDSVSTFAGKHSGVHARLKKHTPCTYLSTAIAHAANSTDGVQACVYYTHHFMKFFYHSPKIHKTSWKFKKVIDLPELNNTKHSDTRWLAHEKCVSTVKRWYACHGSIVTTQANLWRIPLGLSKILTRSSTLFSINLLDFVLPQVSKLHTCKYLQSQNLDLTMIASFLNATLRNSVGNKSVCQSRRKWG